MKLGCVFLCAGKGKRLKEKVPKAFVKVKGEYLFEYSLNTLLHFKKISQIVIVAKKENKKFMTRYLANNKIKLVGGGRRRQDSVFNGLKALDKDIDYVFIHDSARPFIKKKLLAKLAELVVKYKAVIPVKKAQEAVKRVKRGFIAQSLERREIYFSQTPQAFKKELVLKAYGRFGKRYLYDDAQAVELLGEKVKVFPAEENNIKVTYPQDLELAKILL